MHGKLTGIALIVGMTASIMGGCSSSSSPPSGPCTAAEQQVIRSAFENMYKASYQAGFTGDLSTLFRDLSLEGQRLQNELSTTCQQALQRATQSYQGGVGPGGSSSGSTGNVMDHGGGTYSMGGVSCGPSGCVGM